MKTKKKYNLIQTLLLGLTLLVASPTLTMAAETPEKEKSNHTLAMEVILGNWGNGQERKDRLTEAGYEYQAIQDIVNSYQGILYDVSSLMENNTTVKQNGTQETKQVTQAKRSKKTASKKTENKKTTSEKATSEKAVSEKAVSEKAVNEKVVNEKAQSSRLYSLRDLQFHGVINWKGYKFTYYSQRV